MVKPEYSGKSKREQVDAGILDIRLERALVRSRQLLRKGMKGIMSACRRFGNCLRLYCNGRCWNPSHVQAFLIVFYQWLLGP